MRLESLAKREMMIKGITRMIDTTGIALSLKNASRPGTGIVSPVLAGSVMSVELVGHKGTHM